MADKTLTGSKCWQAISCHFTIVDHFQSASSKSGEKEHRELTPSHSRALIDSRTRGTERALTTLSNFGVGYRSDEGKWRRGAQCIDSLWGVIPALKDPVVVSRGSLFIPHQKLREDTAVDR